jgi:hypothetical protein
MAAGGSPTVDTKGKKGPLGANQPVPEPSEPKPSVEPLAAHVQQDFAGLRARQITFTRGELFDRQSLTVGRGGGLDQFRAKTPAKPSGGKSPKRSKGETPPPQNPDAPSVAA